MQICIKSIIQYDPLPCVLLAAYDIWKRANPWWHGNGAYVITRWTHWICLV